MFNAKSLGKFFLEIGDVIDINSWFPGYKVSVNVVDFVIYPDNENKDDNLPKEDFTITLKYGKNKRVINVRVETDDLPF